MACLTLARYQKTNLRVISGFIFSDARSLRTEQTSNDIKSASESLPVFARDSSSVTATSSPLEIIVTGLSVILCLGLIAYVGMAIFEKTVHIRNALHMGNTERNVHYENAYGATDPINFY
ncbi:hypothetical protein MHBO_005012 [Bonamia ostreae]|uniref:Uncharacterized protein n=1 Tax=Bonamia ostreae TaxID=126728 RepID=A0ABV2AUV3_9EUKA